MGWSAGSRFLESAMEYSDKYDLWKDERILKVLGMIVCEMQAEDWDNEDELYKFKTFREICRIYLKDEYRMILEAGY